MNTLKNTVQLMGNLGRNPEVKQLENGTVLTTLRLATNEVYKNSKGEKVIETQWHRLVAWGKTAKYMGELLQKGNEVAIQGKLAYRSYEDKEGVKQYITEVVVQEFVKLTKGTQKEKVVEVATAEA